MPLFQVAIIETKKVKDKPDEEVIHLEPKWVLAKTEQGAVFKTMHENAAKLADADPDNTKVVIRPF